MKTSWGACVCLCAQIGRLADWRIAHTQHTQHTNWQIGRLAAGTHAQHANCSCVCVLRECVRMAGVGEMETRWLDQDIIVKMEANLLRPAPSVGDVIDCGDHTIELLEYISNGRQTRLRRKEKQKETDMFVIFYISCFRGFPTVCFRGFHIGYLLYRLFRGVSYRVFQAVSYRVFQGFFQPCV